MTSKSGLCEQVVIKLALENGNDGIMKRMKLPKEGPLKYLQCQAIRYAFAIEDNVELNLDEYNVRLHYADLEGDAILIANAKDLRSAMKMHLSKKSLKIVARVERANQKTTTSSTTQTKPTPPIQMSHVVEGLVGVLAALAVATSSQVVKVSENIVTELNSRNNTDNNVPSASTDTSSNLPNTADDIDSNKEVATVDADNSTSPNKEDNSASNMAEQGKSDSNTVDKTKVTLPTGSVKDVVFATSMIKDNIRKVVKSAPVKAAISPFKAAVMAQMSATKTDAPTVATAEKPAASASPSTDKDAVVKENAATAAGNVATPASTVDAPEPQTNSSKDDIPFIHGRHTCDKCLTTPIIGKRYHAVHLPDYDLCQNCYESSEKSDSQKFEVAELERDQIFQEKWRRRHARFAGQASRQCRRGMNLPETNRLHHGLRVPYYGGPPMFMNAPPGPHFNNPYHPVASPFTHGHNHQVPSPFVPRCSRDRRQPGFFPQPPPPHGDLFSCPPPMSKHLNTAEYEAEIFEAIRRSLQDTNKGTDGTLKESNVSNKEDNVEAATGIISEEKSVKTISKSSSSSVSDVEETSEKKPDTKPAAIEPEIAVAPVAFGEDVPKSKSSESRDVSYASDADGSVAVVLGQTLDMIANAIDAFNVELHRESGDSVKAASKNEVTEEQPTGEVESSNEGAEQIESDDLSLESPEDQVDYQDFGSDSESEDDSNNDNGVTIVDGVTIGNDDDDSRSSWSVVDDELRMPNDEDIARAAQVIGSALFSSDMARSKSESGNNFDGSTISSVPTVTNSIGNGSNVFNAQFDRWALQLNQLHELGFSNDALMIDIMERLNAANLGSDLEEEVTVSQVVNALMKDM